MLENVFFACTYKPRVIKKSVDVMEVYERGCEVWVWRVGRAVMKSTKHLCSLSTLQINTLHRI